MIESLANKYAGYVQKIREELHMYPEEGFCEIKTSEIIRRELTDMGIPFFASAKTGTVGLIKGKSDEKTVLLRADIDALPIQEETDVSFKSLNKGYMHACGHDVHTAVLLGTAKILMELKTELNGNVKLVFQPAEEGLGGAKPMIDEGIMENPHVDAAFALHVEPLEKIGNIQIRNGAIMACPDEFTIKIQGSGGHGSAPHQCIDPIAISAEIIKEYQTIVRKTISPMIPCVVSVCAIHSGSCANVIPDTAVMEGTVRAIDNETRFKIAEILEEKACKIAENMGGKCDFEYRALYPPVINNEKMNKIITNAAKKLSLIENVAELQYPSMAGDDFSYFSQVVPGAYFRLGVGNEKLSYPIHNSKFNVDNKCFEIGPALMSQIVFDFFE